MRKKLLTGAIVLGLSLGCDTKTPTGPSTVTITEPTPSTTTTSVPVTVTVPPTTSVTTTSIPTPVTTRTYVAFGATAPSQPIQLSVILTPLTGRTSGSLFRELLGLFERQADEPVWDVNGFHRTGTGVGGRVRGQLVGTLDNGFFSGTLTSDSPECTAEREFGGTVDPQFLRWTGGSTLRDCKGSPLAFNNLVMLATTAPPPTTIPTTSTSSIPLQCSYALSASSVSVESTGGVRTVGVTTGASCAWSVQNFVEWIKVQPTNGIGAGTVTLTIDAGPAPRSATVVIAGLPFVVNQVLPTTTTTTTTTILALADLLPVTSTGSFCRRSDSATMLVDVKNIGNAHSVPSFTRVFFDGGPAGTSSADRLTPILAPDATANDLPFAIPQFCRTTNCNILIAADVTGAVPESNEINNSVTATCSFP